MIRRAALVAACLAVVACGSSSGDEPSGGSPTIDDPRASSLAGTGSVDVAIVDAKGELATAKGIAWFELELRLLDDDADVTAGVISTEEGTRVAVDFWSHAEDGSVRAQGRFALDVGRWLGLSVERNPEDIAAIFDGSSVTEGGAPVDLATRDAYLGAVLDAMGDASLIPPVSSKSLKLKGLPDALGTCSAGVKGALSAISATFKTCSPCAASAIDDPTSDATWSACTTCEKAIVDAKSAGGLFDLLSCKKALIVPATGGGDPDDAGGPLVSTPPGLETSTCYASSTDKVHGTFRVVDGKGSVSCADCPDGTTPIDTKLGCAPASGDPYSPVDESKALVMVPVAKGKPGTPRILTSDVCVVVDVSATGTVNGNPVEKGPRRAIYKLGDRGWASLPKNVQPSKDQWDLTKDAHTGDSKGRYAIVASSKAAKTPTSTNSVEDAIARGGCASRPVLGLSQQIAEEVARCVRPGMFVQVPSGGALTNAADLGYLEKPAADALSKALRARPGHTLHVSSMYRTIAQQYFLFRRASCFPAVASPGRSNHETGIAVDVSDPDNSTWKSALEAEGFHWLGSFDRFHFDYKGAGSVDTRGDDVKAFQRLWNRNHPDDVIGEDGVWGAETEKRLKAAPASGFAIGVPDTCAAAETIPTSKGSKEPFPYRTNVTTADLLPGEGCETGSDASHSSVDACISVKQVCEPYWCDLADQRSEGCR
ncbi:MAG: M15 family metallopeptidase [Polyangiales bacterium]